MKWSFQLNRTATRSVLYLLGIATACLLAKSAAAQVVVRVGETVTLPTPIKNATDTGEPGGDTIGSMKLIVTGDAAFVTNPTASSDESLAPGQVKIFTPSFVVGDVPEGPYSVTLKMVSPDVGIDPDPDDPASDTIVELTTSERWFLDEEGCFSV